MREKAPGGRGSRRVLVCFGSQCPRLTLFKTSSSRPQRSSRPTNEMRTGFPREFRKVSAQGQLYFLAVEKSQDKYQHVFGLQCQWACDNPICESTCEPVCESAVCEMQCAEAAPEFCANLHADCDIHCPGDQLWEESCPMCENVCEAPPAECSMCAPVCEHTNCAWGCSSECPEPQCELQCEAPACQALNYNPSNAAHSLAVASIVLLSQ